MQTGKIEVIPRITDQELDELILVLRNLDDMLPRIDDDDPMLPAIEDEWRTVRRILKTIDEK